MGTVHLTSGHHGLYIREAKQDLERRVLLDAELLARPIFNGGKLAKTDGVTRAALQALMDLRGFNAAVSYHVGLEGDGRRIVMPKRVWGEITLTAPDDVVLGFSHDTRFQNRPFYNLLEWLEDDYPDDEMSEDEFKKFCLGWSSAERWRNYFEACLRRKAELIRSEADELRDKASKMQARAKLVEVSLPK